ncbi:MAG: hypothetical protein E3J86_03580 [Candidatus Thorarchaeota archaeon]|nr:MAG: hypothetical protein E3J86_03580 [Candidatus Thorarchaeota archaeon]
MNFGERWRLAGIISTQMRFDGFLENNPGNVARIKENPDKISRSIKSASRINSIMSAFMIVMLAALTIGVTGFDTAIGNLNVRLAIGFSFFLLLSFVLMFFLNLTTATGFFTSGAMKLPSTLPISRQELESLAVLAFARVFIAPAVLTITIFPIASFFLFGPIAGLVTFVGCLANVSVSMRALIGFSRWYHDKTHSSDESRLGTVVRLAATIGLVVGIMSIYMLASYLPFIVEGVLTFAETFTQTYLVLSVLFPFSFGFLASTVTPGVTFLNPLIPIAATVMSLVYGVIAFIFYRQSGNLLRGLTYGGASKGRLGPLREIGIETKTPLMAVIRKDMKMATKSIGSAFVFAIPIFLIMMMYPMIANWGPPTRSMTALTASAYANLFSGISVVSVMMFDTQGASIHEGLPLSSRLILKGKTAITIIPYTLTMILLAILLSMFDPITPLVILIPLIAIPMGYAVPMSVGAAMYRYRGGGRAVAINIAADQRMGLLAGAVGASVGIGPLLGFGFAMMLTGSQIISLGTQALLTLLMVLAAHYQIPKLLKD